MQHDLDALSVTQSDHQVHQVQVGQLAVQPLDLHVEVLDVRVRHLQVQRRLDLTTARRQVTCLDVCSWGRVLWANA